MSKNNKKNKISITKVSIVILTINSKQMLLDMLKNVSRLKTVNLNATCIVVDNGSTDGTKEALANYKRSLPLRGKLPNMNYKFIETGENLGFAGGNNVGIRESLKHKNNFTVIINDDVVLGKDFLVKMTSFMKNNPKVGIASPKIYFTDFRGNVKSAKKPRSLDRGSFTKEEREVIWYAGGNIDWNNIYTSHRGVDEVDKGQFDETVNTGLASGSCMIINNKVFEKTELLDEGFYLYWEDADFSQRVKRNDYEVVYAPVVAIWHKVSASAGGIGSKSNDYFLIRNRLFFAMRYAKFRTKIAVLKDTLKLAFVGRDWQKLGAFHALIGRKGKGPWTKK